MFEHILANWKTSLGGLLLAVATVAGVLSQQGVTLGNAGTGTVVGLIGALAIALLGLLLKDPGNWGSGTKIPLLILAMIMASMASAQTASMSTQATASAIRWNGQWGAGTEQTQSMPVMYWGAQKGNVFSLGAREIVAPSFGWNIYGAVGNYQPDISALMKNTTFNPDQFTVSFDVMGGIATLPAGVSKPAMEGRVNFNYAFTPSVALSGAYAGGGFIGSQRFGVVSAGLQYIFGAGNVPSAAMHRMQVRAAQKRLAIAVGGR
jgi:hypothetical protein